MAALSDPLNLHYLQWVAYLPMFWVLKPGASRANAAYAYLYGFASQFAIFFWMIDTIGLYSNIPIPAAWAILALYAAVFGLPFLAVWTVVHPLRRRLGSGWIVAFPAWWVVLEWLQLYIGLFPYTQGVVQHGFLPVFQLASVTGVLGLSFVVLVVNATLAEWVYRVGERRPAPIGWIMGTGLVVVGIVAWGAVRVARIEAVLEESPTLALAQIQSDVTIREHLSRPRCIGFNEWVAETRRLQPGEADLVVWPESSVDYALNRTYRPSSRKVTYQGVSCSTPENPAQVLSQLAREQQTHLVVGGSSVTRKRRPDGKRVRTAYNSAYLFDGTTGPPARYDKMVPLAFGEYMPLSDTFPWLFDWIEGPGVFGRGTEPVVFQANGFTLATPICYEAILPQVCNRFFGVDLLVNLTNDAWFGDTAEPHQHGMLTVPRAVELGIPLYRSTLSGIGFWVQPSGKVLHKTKVHTRYNRIIRVKMGRVWTLYGALIPYGVQDWFCWLCLFGLVASLVRSGIADDHNSPL